MANLSFPVIVANIPEIVVFAQHRIWLFDGCLYRKQNDLP
jgi:hypothetical protein